jgi:hypothetical protein
MPADTIDSLWATQALQPNEPFQLTYGPDKENQVDRC